MKIEIALPTADNTVYLVVTGHRPQKLGGYNDNPTHTWVKEQLRTMLTRAVAKFGKDRIVVISGMALGVDTWWAEIALEMGLKVHAYIPFVGQESRWNQDSQRHYNNLLARCQNVVNTDPNNSGYAPWKMFLRDQRMAEQGTHLIAVWDGSPSGTGKTVGYWKKRQSVFYHIHPNERTAKWVKTEPKERS